MKKQLKTSLILAGLLSGISGVSFANQDTPTINAPEKVSSGNAFEREMTPLLREISRKKSQLELRKLDRDLEKLDEESLKAQLNMESVINSGSQAKGGYDPFAGKGNQSAAPAPGAMPAGLPGSNPMPAGIVSGVGTATDPIEGASDIKVLMIYGFDDKLYAKVSSGEQGGYAVKKGDVLPNGQVVHNVTANYIEVKKNAGTNKGPIQRIFVSQSVAPVTSGLPRGAISIPGGNSGSTAFSPANLTPQGQANAAAAAALLSPASSSGAVK